MYNYFIVHASNVVLSDQLIVFGRIVGSINEYDNLYIFTFIY